MTPVEAAAFWIVLLASATADGGGSATLELRSGAVDRFEQCSTWRLGEPGEPRHSDPLSFPRRRIGCVPSATDRWCPSWRISVVRDHDGQMLVDVEQDDPPMDDRDIQALAKGLADNAEKSEVLARWPAGSWTQATLCPGDRLALAVQAPHRCLVLAADGKPNPQEFGRGTDTRCAVVPGGGTGAVLYGHGLPAGGSGIRLVGESGEDAFPLAVPAGTTARFAFGLATEHRSLHHVPYSIVAVKAGRD